MSQTAWAKKEERESKSRKTLFQRIIVQQRQAIIDCEAADNRLHAVELHDNQI